MAFIIDNSKTQEEKKFSFQKTESESCVFVIDMQEGFRHIQSELITSEITDLMEKFESDFIYMLFKNESGSLFEKQLDWTKFQTEEDKEIMKEFKEFDFPKYWHSTYSIFTPEILDLIKQKKYKKLYLTGVYTDVSIIKAAMDGFDLGFEMFIFEDATNSLHGKEHHNFAIDSLKHIIGSNHVLKSNQVK